MKKFLLFLAVLPALLTAQSNWKNLTISPANPKPGETIRIEYDWLKGTLAKSDDIEIIAFEYTGDEPVAKEVALQNVGNKLVGTLTTSTNAIVAFVSFQGGERWDNNGGEGYFIQMHNASGQPFPESKAAQAMLYRSVGGNFDLNRKSDTALEMLQQAFAQKPELQRDSRYFPTYLSAYLNVNRNNDESKAASLKLLGELEANSKADEKTLVSIADFYNRLAPDKAKALKDRIISTYPNSVLAKSSLLAPVNQETDLAKKTALLEDFIKKYPPQTDRDRDMIDNTSRGILQAAADQKNWTVFNALSARVSPALKASVCNNVAWGLAEKGEDMNQARLLSSEATQWARMEMAVPSKPKPATLTRTNWEKNRKYTFAMYADTYAFILDKSGNPQTAAEYQAEAVKINEYGNAEFNERFTEYLEHASSPDLRHQLEGFILKGAATAKMKEQFKKLYVAEDKSTAGAASYLAKLEEVARANMKEDLLKKMLDEPAPAFTLKNLQGETVSLQGLKGKVVVVDFWATWCGPCKSSFPGMQQAVDKYKADPNVAFVFVDTWENGGDKEKNASDFIKEKGYTFNVLMDNDNKVVSSFGVSGIPTKFVLDKGGKIRFKSVGYAGSSEALLDELSLMIEAASGQP